MKTLQELLKEIKESPELMDELKTLEDKDALADFLKKYDCGATVEEFKNTVHPEKRELSDDEVEEVAGGEDLDEYYADIAQNTIPIFF